MRALRNGETLCKFGCKTIVKSDLGSCEMCCPKAIAERAARLAPIIEADKKLAEEKSAKLKQAIEEKELDEATSPEAPKKRGRNGSPRSA